MVFVLAEGMARSKENAAGSARRARFRTEKYCLSLDIGSMEPPPRFTCVLFDSRGTGFK